MSYRDIEEKAIHYLAEEYQSGERWVNLKGLSEVTSLDEKDTRKLLDRLSDLFFVLDETKRSKQGYRQSSEKWKLLPEVAIESKELNTPTDKVEATIELLQSHPFWSRVILIFLAASLIVTFCNGLFDLIQKICSRFC